MRATRGPRYCHSLLCPLCPALYILSCPLSLPSDFWKQNVNFLRQNPSSTGRPQSDPSPSPVPRVGPECCRASHCITPPAQSGDARVIQ